MDMDMRTHASNNCSWIARVTTALRDASVDGGGNGLLSADIWLQTGERNETNAIERHVRTKGSWKCNRTYNHRWPHYFVNFNICVACPYLFNLAIKCTSSYTCPIHS
jgi:hypothetical protein